MEGVRTGRADVANSGRISVQYAFRYASVSLEHEGVKQHPQLNNVLNVEGDSLLFARNPMGWSS